jgi:predicted TIM-barrel fold metal-dependent hydrolase
MTAAKNEPVMCAGPHLDVRPPKLKLPPKSADCHCHVFGPRDQYPWAANRLYTPPPVLLDDYLAMLRATGFERGVMVQTGLYGSDNRFIVDAVKAHPKQLRAIALIGEDITDRELRDLTDGGVRGFRVTAPPRPDCRSRWRAGSPRVSRTSAGTYSSCSTSRIIPTLIASLAVSRPRW